MAFAEHNLFADMLEAGHIVGVGFLKGQINHLLIKYLTDTTHISKIKPSQPDVVSSKIN